MILQAEWLTYIASPLRRRSALPATVRTYRQTLTLWERWLAGRDATPEAAQAWLEALVTAGRKTSYVSKNAVCVQSYLQWALKDKEVYLEYHRGFDVRPPTFYYSIEEVQRFIAALTGAPRCALILQFDTALRIGSVLSLRLQYADPVTNRLASDLHLDEDPPAVDVYVKGGRRQRARLTQRGVDAIVRWIEESALDRRRSSKGEREMLFLDWGYRDIYDFYQEAAREAGLAFHGTHALRHAAAVWQMQNGARLQAVSDMLGHRNVNTTAKIYQQLALKDLAAELREW